MPEQTLDSLRKVRALLISLLVALTSFLDASPIGATENSTKIVDSMIEAHGGLALWRQAPTVSFVDEFAPAGGSGMPSSVTVEQGRRRAYIDYPGSEMRLAWDGEKAWSENWDLPYPPRFLALLNYHFLNLPWLAKALVVTTSTRARITRTIEPTRKRSWRVK